MAIGTTERGVAVRRVVRPGIPTHRVGDILEEPDGLYVVTKASGAMLPSAGDWEVFRTSLAWGAMVEEFEMQPRTTSSGVPICVL